MNFLQKKRYKAIKASELLYQIFAVLTVGVAFFSYVSAEDFTSTSFQLENPVTAIEGGQSASSSFQYIGSTGQISAGESTSTSFNQNAGLLYFPIATSPVVSATPGNEQVSLSWSAAVGVLANITNYEVGISTSSGGVYTYSSVGNVLSSIRTSLTNGTPYFFKIRSYALGLFLSESDIVSATPTAPAAPPAGGGGGGGGGGFTPPPAPSNSATTFSGRAYPNSTVVLLKDAQVISSTVAGSNATFSIAVNNLVAGTYLFSVYSEDNQGNRSSLLTFPVSITDGVGSNISGIFLAPTISTDKSQVKKGENINIFGQSTPSSEISILIHSDQEILEKTNSDTDGVYLKVFDSTVLERGDHTAKSKSANNGQISSFSKSVSFAVGDRNILIENKDKCNIRADLSKDCKINLVDFSMLAFWYKKPNPKAEVDLNKDGIVNLVDFSIMAYNWTG